MPLVYLAGPITGLSFDACTDWRVGVRRALLPDIEALSPMRDMAYLEGENVLGDGYNAQTGKMLATDQAIFARDLSDIRRADLLLINLFGAKKVSQGTDIEIGFACALNKPRIIVMEPSGNPHEHAFIRQAASVRVDNLPEAVEIVRSFLLPG